VLQFLWTGTHLGGNGTNVPHEPGTVGPAGVVGLAGTAGPARCGRTCPVPRLRSQSLLSPCAWLGWTIFIKETSVWLNGWSCDHLDQWVHLCDWSTATTVIPIPSWVSLSEGGSSHSLEAGRPHLPTAVTTKTNSSYRPSTASGASKSTGDGS
jgi:hypothetical protein